MKVEVKGLEAAACSLVYMLDRLIIDERGFRLLYPGNGVRVHLPDPLPKGFTTVKIQAVGWDNFSYIEATFVRTIDGWQLCEGGSIVIPHLDELCRGIGFSPTKSGLGLKLVAHDEANHAKVIATVERIVRILRKDLK